MVILFAAQICMIHISNHVIMEKMLALSRIVFVANFKKWNPNDKFISYANMTQTVFQSVVLSSYVYNSLIFPVSSSLSW